MKKPKQLFRFPQKESTNQVQVDSYWNPDGSPSTFDIGAAEGRSGLRCSVQPDREDESGQEFWNQQMLKMANRELPQEEASNEIKNFPIQTIWQPEPKVDEAGHSPSVNTSEVLKSSKQQIQKS